MNDGSNSAVRSERSKRPREHQSAIGEECTQRSSSDSRKRRLNHTQDLGVQHHEARKDAKREERSPEELVHGFQENMQVTVRSAADFALSRSRKVEAPARSCTQGVARSTPDCLHPGSLRHRPRRGNLVSRRCDEANQTEKGHNQGRWLGVAKAREAPEDDETEGHAEGRHHEAEAPDEKKDKGPATDQRPGTKAPRVRQ